MFPLLLGAWLFEASNTGFQTGFLIDAGTGLMSLLSIITLCVLSFEHLFWKVDQQTPWFYFSRLKSRTSFLIGKYLGINFVLCLELIVFALLLSLIIFVTTRSMVLLPFKIAFIIWLEYSLLLSIFTLLSTFLSKLMSVGMMLPIFFISYSIPYLKSLMPNWFGEIILSLLPNSNLFEFAIENNEISYLILILLYSIFMSSFYITLAGLVLRHKDL